MQASISPEKTQFAEDVLAGLSAEPKRLSSMYFYDDEGTRLFQHIMKLPEYYLTGCETEIFRNSTRDIFRAFSNGGDPFEIIELGAGDGTKTAILIEDFLARGADLSYSPIDISTAALDALTSKFRERFPELHISPQEGDYFRVLHSLRSSGRRKILLFLGSNIGNFSRTRSIDFFRSLRDSMGSNDLLFIGFDLHKDPNVILKAYDDPAGVTAAFNLNLLRRINRELGADFDLEGFSHYAMYLPDECAARSFLISRRRQTVEIAALGQSFEFGPWEAVFVEISQKFSLPMIDDLAAESGFAVKQNFLDSRGYYCDSLWKVN